jgi:hypothetical protein
LSEAADDHAEEFFRLVLSGAHDGLLASGGDAGLSAASLRGPRLRLRQRSVNYAASRSPGEGFLLQVTYRGMAHFNPEQAARCHGIFT